jgi:hypothetical protein
MLYSSASSYAFSVGILEVRRLAKFRLSYIYKAGSPITTQNPIFWSIQPITLFPISVSSLGSTRDPRHFSLVFFLSRSRESRLEKRGGRDRVGIEPFDDVTVRRFV